MMPTDELVSYELTDKAPAQHNVLREVIMGLSLSQKSLPAKLLYDARGSELFEKICELPSYYPTRTERQILIDNAREMAELIGTDSLLIEPGSGAAEKVRILLKEMKGRRRYIPIEISREILLRTARELIEEFSPLEIFPVCGDFTKDLELPLTVGSQKGRRVVFFPGSTIGNLDPEEAREFLRKISRLAGTGGGLLIGVDMKKDKGILDRAYNDPEGVTAAFNLNLLERLNRELNAAFVPQNFRHTAFYNEAESRIEMHLESLLPQLVRVNQTVFRFHEGETIHTENSYKYTVDEFIALAGRAGLRPIRQWKDKDSLFCVYYFENE